MRVGSALRLADEADMAAMEAADEVAQRLGDGPCRLAVVFASPHHREEMAGVGAAVTARLEPSVCLGAVAGGIAGPKREVEDEPALVVWALGGDGGEVEGFRSWAVERPEGGMAVAGWPDTEPGDVAVLLADPYSYPAPQVTRHLGQERPGHRIVGGLVSGGQGASCLLRDDVTYEDGAVGVLLRDIPVTSVVSQGCRPVGEPLTVTRADGNVILELAGDPAVERLKELFEDAPDGERELMRSGLQIGLVVDEYRDDFATGDFLVRAVLGADQDRGGVAVGEHVEVGQIVQFQVRDAESAHDDLLDHLPDARPAGGDASGALLFTCNGRGRRFFGQPDHDVTTVGEHLTDTLAGAFCAGEIGPVGDRSFVHGFTASLAVFG